MSEFLDVLLEILTGAGTVLDRETPRWVIGLYLTVVAGMIAVLIWWLASR
jgi:hypothetical protein